MADPRVVNLARLVVNYSVAVKKGDDVQISLPPVAEPFGLELLRETLKAGGHPIMQPYFPRTSEIFFTSASDDQLKWVSPYKKLMARKIKCTIGVSADTNTRSLSGVDPKKLATSAAAGRELSNIFMQRSAKKELRWTAVPYPTEALAQEASMSLSDYEDFVYSACHADKKDAVAEWKRVSAQQEKMVRRLDKVSKLEVHGEDTDLRLSVKGRKWINCDGQYNLPDGEVFTGPIEDSVEGKIRFTFPGIYMGKEIEDIRLEFKKGKVVKAKAAKGEDLLNKLIGIEDGARRVGEFAIGTNFGITRFTKNMLFDEKIGGTIHMALGAGYPETGSKNVAAIHWDILKDMRKGGEIVADGETVYKNGKWLG